MRDSTVIWIFGVWCGIMVSCASASAVFFLKPNSECKAVAHHERNLSPHEQQPEPIPAVTQGGFYVERWSM